MQIGSNGFLQPTLLILRLETDESSVGSVNLLSWFTIRSKWIIIESVQIWMGFNTQSYWSLLVRFNESDELIHNLNVCLSNQSETEWFLTIHYAGNCKLTNFHSVLVLVSQKFIGEEMQCWCVCVYCMRASDFQFSPVAFLLFLLKWWLFLSCATSPDLLITC